MRDTYDYFGCEPGFPTFRYDIMDAVKDPEGPFLCMPKIFDIRSDITTQALKIMAGRSTINEQEENYKIKDLERKIFTPAPQPRDVRRVPQARPARPVRQDREIHHLCRQPAHATNLTKTLNEMQPGIGRDDHLTHP